MSKVKISAGMSHIDSGFLYDHIKEASDAGVDYIHFDCADMTSIPDEPIMGGGTRVIAGFRPATSLPIEVHAHVHGATDKWVNQLADAGVNMIILPVMYYLDGVGAWLIRTARSRGMKFGMTLSMGAPLCMFDQVIYWLDRLHIHTHDVAPGGPLCEIALPMVRKAREMIDKRNPECELACDGGITPENLHKCVEAGADVLIMGRQIFQAEDGITSAVKRARKAIDDAEAQLEARR